MFTAHLVVRIAIDGPRPVMEAIFVSSHAATELTTLAGKVWLELGQYSAPTRERAEEVVLKRARADYALGKLLEQLYVPPALPLEASQSLMVMAQEGRRR